MGKGFGTASLVFGSMCIPISAVTAIFSTIFPVGSLFGLPSEISMLLSIIGWLIPSIAVFFGFIGIVVNNPKGRAIAGFTLGLIGIIFGIVIRIYLENIFTPIYL